MKVTPGVYYYDCEDWVYLRDVNKAKDYLFTPIVYDILETIRVNRGCTQEDICQALAEIYEVESLEELEADVRDFLEELDREQLIQQEQTADANPMSISDQLEAQHQTSGKLFSATLELTYRCNEKCVHCYIDDISPENVKQELTLEEYRSVLDQLRNLGCIHLLITGGEPCIRRDFLDIVGYAVSLGFLVDVYTNGIAMTDEQFDALCKMKVNSVSFSLYSGEEEVHDAITKVPGSFQRTLNRMMMFKCAGVDTYVKTVVIQQNLDSLESLFRLGKRLNIPINPATSISDTHTGASKGGFRLKDQQQRLFAAQLLQKYDPVNLQGMHRDPDGPVCRAGITTLSVDPYGGVHPCLAFTQSLGSVRERTVEDIWRNEPLMKELRSFRFRDLSEKCTGCGHADTCGVCIGAAYSESGGTLCPNTDSCMWAEANYDAAAAAL